MGMKLYPGWTEERQIFFKRVRGWRLRPQPRFGPLWSIDIPTATALPELMELENAVQGGLLLIAMAYGCYASLSRQKADLKEEKTYQDWLMRERELFRALMDQADEIRSSDAKTKGKDGA